MVSGVGESPGPRGYVPWPTLSFSLTLKIVISKVIPGSGQEEVILISTRWRFLRRSGGNIQIKRFQECWRKEIGLPTGWGSVPLILRKEAYPLEEGIFPAGC